MGIRLRWRYFGLLERALKHVDLFIAPSRFSKQKQRAMGLDVPIAYLPYFNLESNGGVKTVAPPSAQPYFLFVGPLEKIKRAANIDPALPTLRQR